MALTATAEQSNSKRGLIIGIVLALHAGGIYVMESGLSRTIIEMIAPPVETKIIEEEIQQEELPPPPPPPEFEQPPPFIPPPEVTVQVQASTTAIQTVTSERPPAVVPPVMAPPAPVAVPGTKPKLDLKKSRASDDYYPAASNRADETGSVQVRCFLKIDGRCSESSIVKSSGFERLDAAALKYANEGIRFVPGTTNGKPEPMWYEFLVTFKQKR